VRFLRPSLVLAAVLVQPPAFAQAVKEWYVHYDDGKRYLARGQCKEAIASFRQAEKLRPRSQLQVQTYGLNFIDYLPYYHQGRCHLRLGEYAAAELQFNIEEKQGAIKRHALYPQLLSERTEAQTRGRAEAEDGERRQRARRALEEVQRLRREADEHLRGGRPEAAQASLLQAQKLAELIDPGTQADIAERIQKIQAERQSRADQAARAEKVEKGLEAGARLLDQGSYVEAKLRFDDVLAVDSANARAREGRRRAEEGILAESTRQQLQGLLSEGRALFAKGEYEQALRPLSEAAADPANTEARDLLARVRATLEGLQHQKDLASRVALLLAQGERLVEERNYPEAMVVLGTILQLDPTHVRARERLEFAERMTGHELFERIFPNQAPVLLFAETPPGQVLSATVAVVGLATDDRGVSRVEYRHGAQVLDAQTLAPTPESGEFPRAFRIEKVFAVERGDNDISVSVTDTSGVARTETFHVRRELRFYETRAFLPSAIGAAASLVGLGLLGQRLRRRRALMRRFNPYIAGAPVMDEDMFFGRRKLLTRILNVLHHNSLMITGERRIGKTTFLYRLRKELQADEGTEYRFFPAFIDLQGVTEEDFFHAVMSDVVEELLPSAETRAALRWRQETDAYDGRDFSHDLQRIVEELKGRTSRQVKLALLIDEVDVLNQFSERINQRLRGIFMKTFSEHLVAVMSGVGIRRNWTSEGSPWYNFFDEVELTAFTPEEAEELIRQPVEGVFRFAPEAVERILELSGLKPYVIQKYCVQAVNAMLEEGKTTVTLAHVEAVRPFVQTEPLEDEPAAVRSYPRQPASA
jgi:hypothetical protein